MNVQGYSVAFMIPKDYAIFLMAYKQTNYMI